MDDLIAPKRALDLCEGLQTFAAIVAIVDMPPAGIASFAPAR